MFYEYLQTTYGMNEPILIAEIQYKNMSDGSIRQQIKKLTDAGMLKRYDTGIYFIPKKSSFKSGSQLSINRVIEKKYLKTADNQCGYISGVGFANQLGITTQVSMVFEVVTNKATNDYREVSIAKSKIILRRPRITVDKKNYKILQFLDLIKDLDSFAEISGYELQQCIFGYLKRNNIRFADLEPYLPYYPERIYANLYKVRLLYWNSCITTKNNLEKQLT